MKNIIPCLWFDSEAVAAAEFYISVFGDGKITETTLYNTETPSNKPIGSVLTVEFEIKGHKFLGLNGGPIFKPNPSISFMVNFDPSKDPDARVKLDTAWEKLVEGGKVLMPIDKYPFSERYGWVEDKYGLSWQLILTNPEGEDRPFIIPSLLFVTDTGVQAEAATNFYLSVFGDTPSNTSGLTKRGQLVRYPAGMPDNKEGTIMFTDFMLEGKWFTAMDGSSAMHKFAFNEAVSFIVECKTQEEIDTYWNALSAVKESEMCGWLKDKYGVSWQIVPEGMGQALNDPDKERAKRKMEAMMKMKKIDIEVLKNA